MIRDSYSSFGKCNIALICNQCSLEYCNTLQGNVMEFPALEYEVGWQFPQDNASVHVSRVAETWFTGKTSKLLAGRPSLRIWTELKIYGAFL